MKKTVLFSVVILTLFCTGRLSAQPNFFFNVHGGMNVTADTDFGVTIHSGGEHFAGWGEFVSLHLGFENLNYFSFETGVDFFFNTRFSYLIGETTAVFQYNIIDIPVLIKLFIPIAGGFAIQPNLGVYITFPQYDTFKVKDKDSTDEFDLERFVFLAHIGIQEGLRISYEFGKNSLFFGAYLKHDLIPTMAIDTWHIAVFGFKRLTVPFFIGYERKI
jgi:hypothetical protein